MIIELRSVPDCPNLQPVRQELLAALDELGLRVEVRELVGDYPSPSVLVNGADVMGGSGDGPACCRLDLPDRERIRAGLQRAEAAEPCAAATAAAPSPVDCCTQQHDAATAGRAHRALLLPAGLRRLHQAILRRFAATAAAPGPAELAAFANAAGWQVAAALERLERENLIALDATGRLIAAYPFSPDPTPHVVDLGGVRVHAMCAIDALGMPFMLGTDAVIASTCPQSGQPVHVQVSGDVATYQPPRAVVVYAAGPLAGRSIDTCCSTINFFASPDTARAWITAHPNLSATILDQQQALARGRATFELLLQDQPPGTPGVAPAP